MLLDLEIMLLDCDVAYPNNLVCTRYRRLFYDLTDLTCASRASVIFGLVSSAFEIFFYLLLLRFSFLEVCIVR